VEIKESKQVWVFWSKAESLQYAGRAVESVCVKAQKSSEQSLPLFLAAAADTDNGVDQVYCCDDADISPSLYTVLVSRAKPVSSVIYTEQICNN